MVVGAQPLAGRMNTREVEAVVFDVGGVLVQMGDIAALGPFNGIADAAGIRTLWLDCLHVDAHERGHIDIDEFSRRMVEHYAIPGTPEDFIQRFLVWPGALYPGVEETLAQLAQKVKVACLSNTCAFHWAGDTWAKDVRRLSPRLFLSFEMGLMKPERAIYDRTAEALGIAPERILFFDDTERNIVGAKLAGWDAHRVDGIAEVRQVLKDYDLI